MCFPVKLQDHNMFASYHRIVPLITYEMLHYQIGFPHIVKYFIPQHPKSKNFIFN